MDLSFEQQRVKHGADIVAYGVAHQRRASGFRIDLDLADMSAVGEGWCGRLEHAARLQSGLEFGRQGAPVEGELCHLLERQRAVGAGDREPMIRLAACMSALPPAPDDREPKVP